MSVFKVLGQVNTAATTNTTLYTVPATTTTVISSINVCNIGNSILKFRIAIRPAGAVLSNEHYVYYDENMSATSAVTIKPGWTLATTDVITVYATTANACFSVFGEEF